MLLSLTLLLLAAGDPPGVNVVVPEAMSADRASRAIASFSDAALACSEATQGIEFDASKLTDRGWTEKSARPDVAKIVRLFSREDATLVITVFNATKQCSVVWAARSSGNANATASAVNESVLETMRKAYGRRLKAETPTHNATKWQQQLAAGSSLGMLTQITAAGLFDIQFMAMNRDNYRALPTNQTNNGGGNSSRAGN